MMNLGLIKFTMILISFVFLTGFLSFAALIGPFTTMVTSGNIYKAGTQFIIDQSIKKKTGKNSFMLVKEEIEKKDNERDLNKKLRQLVEKRIKNARQNLDLQKINQ